MNFQHKLNGPLLLRGSTSKYLFWSLLWSTQVWLQLFCNLLLATQRLSPSGMELIKAPMPLTCLTLVWTTTLASHLTEIFPDPLGNQPLFRAPFPLWAHHASHRTINTGFISLERRLSLCPISLCIGNASFRSSYENKLGIQYIF